MHGWHQVAQKFKTTTSPSKELFVTVVPSSDLSEKLGAWPPTLSSSELLLESLQLDRINADRQKSTFTDHDFIRLLLEFCIQSSTP